MNLKCLKDKELEASFQRVVATERKVLHVVILHVQEVARRKLYLARGYSSLFSYLTSELKYSNAAAQRRIEAARIVCAVPAVAAKIESGEINLSQLSEIQKAVKSAESFHHAKVSAETKAKLVQAIEKKTTPETQQLCAEILDIPVIQQENIKTQKDHSKQLEISLSKEQYAKFEKVKALLAHKHFQTNRTQSFAEVLETIFDEIIAKHELPPKRAVKKATITKDVRKTKSETAPRSKGVQNSESITSETEMNFPYDPRSSVASVSGSKVSCVEAHCVSGSELSYVEATGASEPEAKWHSLTPKRKKIILSRDQCCQFKDHSSGKVCGSQFQLEVDHIKPKWDGGTNDAANLQVLCRMHNQFRYRQ